MDVPAIMEELAALLRRHGHEGWALSLPRATEHWHVARCSAEPDVPTRLLRDVIAMMEHRFGPIDAAPLLRDDGSLDDDAATRRAELLAMLRG